MSSGTSATSSPITTQLYEIFTVDFKLNSENLRLSTFCSLFPFSFFYFICWKSEIFAAFGVRYEIHDIAITTLQFGANIRQTCCRGFDHYIIMSDCKRHNIYTTPALKFLVFRSAHSFFGRYLTSCESQNDWLPTACTLSS